MSGPSQPAPLERRYRVVLPAAAETYIVLVGVGGTGSWLATALARILYHGRQKGERLQLMLADPDVVSPANIGRQGYAPAGGGANKAEILAWRLNMALGLDVAAVAAPFTAGDLPAWLDQPLRSSRYGRPERVILVGAVDNYLARRELATATAAGGGQVWAVDCGNAYENGQVLAGNLTDLSQLAIDEMGLCSGLPSPYLQEPALLEPEPADETPFSCADLTLREEQSLLINAQVAAVAAQYVYDLVIRRTLGQYATYLNLQPPVMNSLVLTPTNLARFSPPVNSNVTV